jgi:hypothetical protein
VLQIAGEKSCHHLAATLTRLVEYFRDPQSIGSTTTVSNSEALDVLGMCGTVRDSLAICLGGGLDKVTSGSRIAWLHYLATEHAPEMVAPFFTKLGTGEMLSAQDPVYTLRARMIADRASNSKLPNREVQALIVKAWNAHVTNTPIKVLRWHEKEVFPLLKFGIASKESGAPLAARAA